MKNLIQKLDGTPHKRLILSIVSDYDLLRSICELIDNALDIWIKNGKASKLTVSIDFDLQQKTISIKDNAGGVHEKELSYLISPGATTNKPEDLTIGIFGVGTKRAVIALSEDIKITSRHKNGKTFSLEFDKKWLADDSWELPYYEVDEIDKESTIVHLQALRININESEINGLSVRLSEIYANFFEKNKFEILVNGLLIKPVKFENWAYPPGFAPRKYHGNIKTREGRTVEVEVLAGLTLESSPAGGEYGVYFYCNDRLIASALKTPEVGFITNIAGKPHPSLSLTRIIVSFKGASMDMPWNSSKSDINTNHYIFNEFRNWLYDVVKNYTSLSRRLAGNWEEDVFKYKTGKIIDFPIADFHSTNKAYLLELPKVNEKYVDKVKRKNSSIEKKKPWTTGLYEGVIASDIVLRQNLDTKNRIALVLLDSVLEIGFKDYLVNDSGKYYSNTDLLRIFAQRYLVHNEIKKYFTTKDITAAQWGIIKFYYDLRCKLVHERATVNITDKQINEQRKVVEKVLKKLFKLKF